MGKQKTNIFQNRGNGRGLISFAAWKKHVALYPAPRGIEQFKIEKKFLSDVENPGFDPTIL
jgi:uncharacterized protein YdhG (YjbR/CyaY superfamily)